MEPVAHVVDAGLLKLRAGPGVEAWEVLLELGLVLEPQVESWSCCRAGPGPGVSESITI